MAEKWGFMVSDGRTRARETGYNMKRAIVPKSMESLYDDWRMSPGLLRDGFLFLTGFSGMSLDGRVSADPGEQIETAFAQVEAVLKEAGATFGDVVEMTIYQSKCVASIRY